MSNEEMLELLRADRPGQTIHEVRAFRPHPMKGTLGVEWEVDAVIQLDDFFGTTIRRVNVRLPYPITKGYSDWVALHSGDASQEIMGFPFYDENKAEKIVKTGKHIKNDE